MEKSTTVTHKILVAEDDAFSQTAVSVILKSLKLNFSMVADGQKAYDAYISTKDLTLVLMDLHMPNLDGFEAAKKIRQYEQAKGLSKCKILALSAGIII